MSEMVTSQGVPEVQLGSTQVVEAKNVGLPPSFSGKWEDMGKDLESIAKEMHPPAQPEASAPAPVTEAPKSEATAPVDPKAEVKPEVKASAVPEKFKTPEGQVDVEKMAKSYLEAERRLKQVQNQQRTVTAPAPQPQTQPVPAVNVQLSPLELQVAQDIFDQGRAGFTEQQAISLARTQVRLADAQQRATEAATRQDYAQVQEHIQEQARQKELEGVAKFAPWVLTNAGRDELIKVIEENPYMAHSAQPWRTATLHLLGLKQITGNSGQVNMPIPQGAQQTAPPLPVAPAQRAEAPIQLNTPAEIEAYVKTLNPQQEAEFWKKSGLPWKDTPKTNQAF